MLKAAEKDVGRCKHRIDELNNLLSSDLEQYYNKDATLKYFYNSPETLREYCKWEIKNVERELNTVHKTLESLSQDSFQFSIIDAMGVEVSDFSIEDLLEDFFN